MNASDKARRHGRRALRAIFHGRSLDYILLTARLAARYARRSDIFRAMNPGGAEPSERRDFSRIASAVAIASNDQNAGDEDISMMGAPTECYELVARQYVAAIDKAMREHGWTHEDYDEELVRRTSAKFALLNDLYCH